MNDYGLVRVASAVPEMNVADVDFNVEKIMECVADAIRKRASLVVFPELSLTGYTCADLFGSELLLDASDRGLLRIADFSADKDIAIVVGAPVRHRGHLYNCAVVVFRGQMWLVPKSYLPNYKEFYEKRWFSSADNSVNVASVTIGGRECAFGRNLLFRSGKLVFGVEICEDLWVPIPPSSVAAINGANMILNLSASNEVIGKHKFLVNLIKHQSNQCIAAYIYSSSGYGESTTDLVFAGNAIISENGNILKSGERFSMKSQVVVADVDVEALENERRINESFGDSIRDFARHYECVDLDLPRLDYDDKVKLERKIKRTPFVPTDDVRLNARCEEIVNIQTEGLMRRLHAIHCDALVVGISGGLDSTLALLVAAHAFDRLGLDRKGIYGITMPGFGTTDRTYTNAVEMMRRLGVSVREIPIAAAVKQHFKDIDHNASVHDVVYENSQARERTQILMDYANKVGGIVLGTGDLSELALGWATYNGDHMSMYNVNNSIPKTLAKDLVKWFANTVYRKDQEISHILNDVLATPISPELTPADDFGQIKQKTEDLVGPYELHDFFLFNMIRYGYRPRKLYLFAKTAFKGEYEPDVIKKWLKVFVRRFFMQQFKRSCLPDGPKVGSVSLSPRGDWRMPSDAAASLWLKDCDSL